jgi:hypothetical protein
MRERNLIKKWTAASARAYPRVRWSPFGANDGTQADSGRMGPIRNGPRWGLSRGKTAK